MRTNIEIDDELMKEALARTGSKTKKEVVEMGLQTLVRLRRQEESLRSLRGILKDEGWGWGDPRETYFDEPQETPATLK